MRAAQILIIDLLPQRCPKDHGRHLAGLRQDGLTTKAINTQTVTHIPPHCFSPVPDLIVLRPASDTNLLETTQRLRKRWSPMTILGLFCCGEHASAIVSQCLNNGVDDFITCPFRDLDVFPRIQRFLPEQGRTVMTPQAAEIKAKLHIEGLVGESKPFLQALDIVLSVANSDATVLIAGETGTGKEVIAQAVHYQSPRRDKPFIPLNCGALPDHLFENELFEQGVIALFQGLYPGLPVMLIEIVISAHGGVRMRRVDSEGLLW